MVFYSYVFHLFARNHQYSLPAQKAALAMQEQERLANEEEEKRLKAALTAKREAVAVTSRVSSPVVKDSAVEQQAPVPDISSKEDIKMEIDLPPAVSAIQCM